MLVDVCEEQLADNGQVVAVCRKLAATDVPVVIGALVVVLLVLPLFSELSFFGVTLKRAVENTAKKAKELEDRVDRLTTIASAVASSEVKVSVGWLDREARELAEGEQSTEQVVQDALLKEMLLSVWNRLQPYLTYVPPEETTWIGGVELPVRSWPETSAFARQHAQEINRVREARNAIANGIPIPDELLRAAIESGNRLLGIAEAEYRK
jgi:hypothetical protein